MKIICIDPNYRDRAGESGETVPTEPVFYCRPDTALLRNEDPFYIPGFTQEVRYGAGLVVRVSRLAKAVEERYAGRCYEEVAVGVGFTAEDLRRGCVRQGLPWEQAQAFDKSMAVPNVFLPKGEGCDPEDADFRLDVNGRTVQRGRTADMLFSVDRIVSWVSRFITLRIGDLIFTGTPAGAGTARMGDRLEAYLGAKKMLDFEIK